MLSILYFVTLSASVFYVNDFYRLFKFSSFCLQLIIQSIYNCCLTGFDCIRLIIRYDWNGGPFIKTMYTFFNQMYFIIDYWVQCSFLFNQQLPCVFSSRIMFNSHIVFSSDIVFSFYIVFSSHGVLNSHIVFSSHIVFNSHIVFSSHIRLSFHTKFVCVLSLADAQIPLEVWSSNCDLYYFNFIPHGLVTSPFSPETISFVEYTLSVTVIVGGNSISDLSPNPIRGCVSLSNIILGTQRLCSSKYW